MFLYGENLRLHYIHDCSPISVVCSSYSKILPVTKMRLTVCFNEKWRYLDHLQILLKAVAAMAEMKVGPQEEMAKPQEMKVFAVERPGLPVDFVFLLALCGVRSSPTRICSESADCLGSATYSGRHRGRHRA